MNIEIEKLTTWSAGREVRTQNGPRILRKGPLTAEYRAAWRANKEAMKAVGLSMGPVDRNDPQGEWEAIWWQPIDGELARKRDEAVEASRATDAAVDIPAPDGLAYMPFQKAGIAFALRVFGIDVSKAESHNTARKEQAYAKGSLQTQENVRAVAGSASDNGPLLGSGEDNRSAGACSPHIESQRDGGMEKESQRSHVRGIAQAGRENTALDVHDGKGVPIQGRERTGSSRESIGIGSEVGAVGIHSGVSGQDGGTQNGTERAYQLQGGLRTPGTDDRSGGGRAMSQDIQGESSRREKDHRPECARVDSCESQTLNRKGCPSRSVGVLLADEMGL